MIISWGWKLRSRVKALSVSEKEFFSILLQSYRLITRGSLLVHVETCTLQTNISALNHRNCRASFWANLLLLGEDVIFILKCFWLRVEDWRSVNSSWAEHLDAFLLPRTLIWAALAILKLPSPEEERSLGSMFSIFGVTRKSQSYTQNHH